MYDCFYCYSDNTKLHSNKQTIEQTHINMTFKMNILASDEAQYLDADSVKTERTCLSKDGKSTVLWKIGTKYYVEINTYCDENFWQGEDNAFERSEYIVEVKELTDEEVEEYFEAYKSYEPALYE